MNERSSPDIEDAMGVTDRDREFAAQILEDFSSFEEGIENEEKLAQWIRNVRRNAVSEPARLSAGTEDAATPRETPGALGWTISEETKKQIEEIDRNIREAPQNIARMANVAQPSAGTGRPHEAPEWLWYGEVDGKPVVTFGRWPKAGAQWRYKWADIQPTEHDHPDAAQPSIRCPSCGKAARAAIYCACSIQTDGK